MIAIECKKCGHTLGYLRVGEIHTGLHCAQCNSWIKWVSKNEIEILNDGKSIVMDEIDVINEIDIKALEKQRDLLNFKIDKYYKKETEKIIANNNGYVGKTFKRLLKNDTIGYYKIISVDNNNQYRMNTLVFSLPIVPFASSHDVFNEESIMAIESIGWFCNSLSDYGIPSREIDSYVEISNEEFEKAFDNWLEKIKAVIKNE